MEIANALEEIIARDFPLTEMPTPLQRERSAHEAFAASRAR